VSLVIFRCRVFGFFTPPSSLTFSLLVAGASALTAVHRFTCGPLQDLGSRDACNATKNARVEDLVGAFLW
jgi:hypothetical protein